jgi:hypothetical protein
VSLRLYIYWKVQPQRLAEATDAVRRFQANHPGAEPTLLRRSEGTEPPGVVTLMETYAAQDEPACAALASAAQAALGHLAVGGRHVERFEPA